MPLAEAALAAEVTQSPAGHLVDRAQQLVHQVADLATLTKTAPGAEAITLAAPALFATAAVLVTTTILLTAVIAPAFVTVTTLVGVVGATAIGVPEIVTSTAHAATGMKLYAG
ncbi:MAG: hypothetical protein AB7J86_15580 [Vulcanimicrobiota bacterium]